MKTHPHLLVRDALAGLFVAASAGEPDALARIAALAAWCEDGAPPPQIEAEDGVALFEGASLAQRFESLEPYVRDRARRFAAACAWIQRDGCAGQPIARARAAWDAGLFFEVHELLEPVWLAERGAGRERLQALILAGAALHQLCEGKTAGARGLLGDASRRLLRDDAPCEFDLAQFGHGLARLRSGIDAGEIKNIEDVGDLPRLEPIDRSGRLR
jgi:hypothetical protein